MPRIPVVASLADLESRVDVVVTLGASSGGAKEVSLRAAEFGRADWLAALGRLWELGAPVAWTGPGRRVDLPTYPFQRTRFWPENAVEGLGRLTETIEVDVPQQRKSYARPDLRTPYLPPRTPTERTVAQVWQDGLGIDAIGVHDPFFELGGTSVVGLAVVSRLAKDFGVELTAATLFERPTVAQFAELLDAERAPTAAPAPSVVDAQAARGARRRAMAQARNRK
jgi:hypothetical protein